MTNTSIQWTDRTWNPVRGCSRVSPGCDNCYAMRQAHRFSGDGKPYEGLTVLRKGKVDWRGHARLVPEMLDQPLRWKKPARIFVNSMSDLFHSSLSNEEIAAVLGVMAACPQHTFQILTKRPERMVEWFNWLAWFPASLGGPTVNAGRGARWHTQQYLHDLKVYDPLQPWVWPLPNVWLGVSVEDQKTADRRIPLLLKTPAAVRFVSAEPLLESVAFERSFFSGATERRYNWLDGKGIEFSADGGAGMWTDPHIDWVIVGGESGHGARPCDTLWSSSVAEQCASARVPCFVKQLGSVPVVNSHPNNRLAPTRLQFMDKAGGDPNEWPDELRVRQFPGAS